VFKDFDGENNEDYEQLKEDLMNSKFELEKKLSSSNVQNMTFYSDEVLEEIKDLLWLFGIPFIVAPFEAESQCAQLEKLGLVDGVVTEDSDVLLFGAQNVYKNIFHKNKFVETYKSNMIYKELGLSRQDLIHLALFLGSDYTMGVKGIGPVNAIEIIHSFPGTIGLMRFKKWAEKSAFEKEEELKDGNKLTLGSDEELEYKKRHMGYKKHWEFPQNFPSENAISEYQNPQIDPSQEKFKWGEINYEAIRKLCVRKLGWDLV
jgi:DNA excision repair protein ERCC-5